jgi:hypothetical protein
MSKSKLPVPVFPPGEPEWLSRKRRVSIPYAAGLRGLSVDTFRRRHSNLIEKLSDRRDGVELGKVLDLNNTEV